MVANPAARRVRRKKAQRSAWTNATPKAARGTAAANAFRPPTLRVAWEKLRAVDRHWVSPGKFLKGFLKHFAKKRELRQPSQSRVARPCRNGSLLKWFLFSLAEMKIAAPHAAVKDSYRWSPCVKDEHKFSSGRHRVFCNSGNRDL